MGTVRRVGDVYFVYGWSRVLGPYNTELEAYRAMRREGEGVGPAFRKTLSQGA